MLRIDLNLVYTMINLLILYFVLRKFLFKPVNEIIAKRQEEADKQFSEAEKTRMEAEKIKEQCEETMRSVHDEKNKAIKEGKQQGIAEYNRIIEEANIKADTIVKSAIAEAEVEKAKIIKSAQVEIADMVVNATAKVVGAKTPDVSDKDLYDEFLRKAGD